MSHPWTIVLAGGAGRRLASLTGGVPKQFWSAPGRSSLLTETLRRFAPLSVPARTVIIADASHRAYLAGTDQVRGTVVYQPRDRGTAAGVLLSLTPALVADRDSIVVITPADHGVRRPDRFLEGIRAAIDTVRTTDGIVVFGVAPTSARDDYGWILPDVRSQSIFRPIARFIEKPEKVVAEHLLKSGAAWNTMVVVARARALRDLCFQFAPPLKAAFKAAINGPDARRQAALDRAYDVLPHCDFSRDVLSNARALLTYIWPLEIGWSDLGTPERMLEWWARVRSATGRAGVTAA